MSDGTFETGLLVALAIAAIAIYWDLGRRMGRRKVSEDASWANLAWRAWWMLLASSSLVGTVLNTGLDAIDMYDLAWGLTLLTTNIVLIFAALWCLSFYLSYVIRGTRRWASPLAYFYSLNALLWLYVIFDSGPEGVDRTGSTVAVAFRSTLESHPLYVPLFLGLIVPVMIGAGAYGWLGFKAQDRTVKIRITVVGVGIFLWFGSSLIATAIGLSDWHWWPVASRMIGLATAGAIWLAHFPPAGVARRIGIEPLRLDTD